MRRLGAPRRLVNVIEGESLVNDATALVVYRVAVGGGRRRQLLARSTRASSSSRPPPAGIAIGLGGRRTSSPRSGARLDDTPTEVTISLLTAYAAFIPADALGLSGVLAAVTAGIYLGWRAPEVASPETRLQGFAIWEILVFLLNATLFILIGLQLPVIVDGLDGRSTGEVLGYSALVCAAVDRGALRLDLHGAVRGPRARPPAGAARAARGRAPARRVARGRDARRGLARGRAGAAARDRRRRAAARAAT